MTDKIVLLALSKIVVLFGASAFNASCRRLAETAEINKVTINKLLKRLLKKKRIEIPRNDCYGPYSYKINFVLMKINNTLNLLIEIQNVCPQLKQLIRSCFFSD